MGDATEKLSGKLGIDTTDFKTGISSANRELRVLESGFRAGVAALGDWSNSATGLESRIKTLTSSIDIQKLKVAAVREEYERVKTEKGENSRAAQDLEIKLNKETETLGKMESELGNTETALQEMQSGSNEAGDATEEAGEQAEEAGGKFQGFGAVLTGTLAIAKGLAVGLLAVVGIVAALGAAVIGLTFSSAATADEIATLSVQTGIGTDRLQEMKYAGDQLGFTLDTVTGANARLIRSMDDAAQKADGEMGKAFETLGVDVVDLNGNLRDSEEVFNETIDALAKIENPAERDALAMQIFGKSAQELNPLIKAGSDELARLSEEARNNGAVVSGETITALAGLQDQLDGLKGGLLGVGMTLAGTFSPFFSGVLGQAQVYLQELVGIISGSGGDFGKMAEGLAGLFTRIAGDIASQAPAMLEAGLSIVQSILTAIQSALPDLLTAGVAIIQSLVNFIVANLPSLINAAVQILLMLVNAIVQNLPMLVDAALKAIIALADGLSAAAPELVPVMVEAIVLIVQAILDNLPALLQAGAELIIALATGLANAARQQLGPKGMQAIEDFLTGIALGAIKLVNGAKIIIDSIKQGLENPLKMMVDSFSNSLIGQLLQGVAKLAGQLLTAGRSIVEGVWQGIEAARDWFYSLIYDFFSGMVESILSALGISSPSKVGIGIGDNFIGSVGIGAMRQFERVEQQFRAGFTTLANTFSPVASPALAAAPSGGDTYNIYLWGSSVGQRDRSTPIGDILKEFNIK